MNINSVRRFILRGLTSGLGNTSPLKGPIPGLDPAQIKRVLLCRPNGRLGNQLLLTPLVKEISEEFPSCKIDLFVKGKLSRILFKNYPQVDRIISLPGKPFRHLFSYMKVWIDLRRYSYDLVVNVIQNSSSGRLASSIARGKYKLFCEYPDGEPLPDDCMHMAKKPVYCLRNFISGQYGGKNNQPVPQLDIRLSKEDLEHGAKVLHDLVGTDKKTISLYTFATGSKCFSKEWWMKFYNTLKQRFGDEYNFVEILPVENVSQIDFKEISFYSRDLFEIAAVMANTEMYIGADCGIMHLAGAAHIPVVALFSVTDPRVYQVYGNNSVAIKITEVTDIEEIVERIDAILRDKKNTVD